MFDMKAHEYYRMKEYAECPRPYGNGIRINKSSEEIKKELLAKFGCDSIEDFIKEFLAKFDCDSIEDFFQNYELFDFELNND